MAKAYGVSDLAKKLDLQEASVRVGLRNRGISKNKDGVYEFDAGKFNKIVDEWDKGSGKKSAPKKSAKKAKGKAVKKAAPKKKAKKATPKATVKKAATDDAAED